MTEEVTLAPCPFCGGEGLPHRVPHLPKLYRIACKNCDAGPSARFDSYQAIAAWNARANQPPAQDGLVEALQELLKIGVPRMWKCERGDYCVSIMQKEYFGATLSEAADAALASLGDKP